MSSVDYLTEEEEEEDMLFPFRVGDIIRDTSMMGGRFLAVTELLGQGAYAVVYQVKDTKTGKLYALKCLCKRGLSWEQLTLQREEAKLQKSLGQHPNIVRLERYFENKDWLFLVLEYCSGSDLFCWITEKQDEFDSQGRRRSPMERRQLIKNVFKQILTAVTYCHSRGVFHRDLKPENFLITAGGNVKLCDFGLATTEEASQDFDCGSKPYMSYECRVELNATYSPRQADIWSLGILLLSILYRRTPWAEAVPDTNHNFNRYLQDPFSYLYHEFGCEYDLADFLARRVLSPVKQRISCADWLRLWTDNVIFTCSINITGRRASPLRPDTSRLRELLDEIKEQGKPAPVVTLKRKSSWSDVLDEEDEMDFSAPMVFEEDEEDTTTDVEEEPRDFGVINCSPAANPSEFAIPTPIKVSTSMCTMVGTPTPSTLFNTPALIKRYSFAVVDDANDVGGGEDEMIFAMDVL